MYKTIYIGNYYPIAEYILFHNDYELNYIICETDRITDDLLTFSLVRNIPIKRVDKNHRIEDIINSFDEDVVFIMCSYGRRVPIEKCGKHRLFNIHFSELPKYKGRHPSFWATYFNELYLGVTIHAVTFEFDRGDIITQRVVPYYLWETEKDIFNKQTCQVPMLLDGLSDYLVNGNILKNNSIDSYFPPVEKKDITINIYDDSPDLIFNKVRSQVKCNGAIIYIEGRVFHLLHICFTEKEIDSIYTIEEDCLYIRYKEKICIKSGNYWEEKTCVEQ